MKKLNVAGTVNVGPAPVTPQEAQALAALADVARTNWSSLTPCQRDRIRLVLDAARARGWQEPTSQESTS